MLLVQRPSRREALSCRAIGFDFGDRAEPDAPPKPTIKFQTFGLRSASLLVFSNVLKGAVGEAFLGVVASAIKFQVMLPCRWY